MPPGILALIAGKAKSSKGDDAAPASERPEMMMGKPDDEMGEMGGSERTYAKEAFSALKDDDEAGFIDAFVGAVRACMKKSQDAGYEGEADEA